MGKLGEEVSQKIKSAIRAKLIELGINMENELPDYVMVLVANKKSQKQMEDDLQLFLGSSTTVFTTWLHNVLKKLEQVTVSSKDVISEDRDNVPVERESGRSILKAKFKSRDAVKNTSEIETRKISPKEEKDEKGMGEASKDKSLWSKNRDVERRKTIEFVNDDLQDVDKDSGDHFIMKNKMEKSYQVEKIRKFKEPREDEIKMKDEIKIKDAREILEQKAKKNERQQDRREENLDEKDRKRKQLPSVSKLIVHQAQKSVDVSIPSIVKVTPRPIRRCGIQANCNLILKAVADAEKSVATAKNVHKLKENIRRTRSRDELVDYIPPVKIAITLPNDRVPSTKDEEKQGNDDKGVKKNCDNQMDVEEESSTNSENPSSQLTYEEGEEEKWTNNVEPKFLVTLGKKGTDQFLDENWDSEEGIDLGVSIEEDMEDDLFKNSDSKDSYQRIVYPKVPFNRNRLGPAPVVAVRPLQKDSEARNEAKQDKEMLEDEQKKLVQSKVLKRCKYWPNCLVGDSCTYHHPEIMCRLFPNCKFGDQCIYVHPPCKYGERCHNLSCKYMHVWNPNIVIKAVPSVPEGKTSSQQCMFYPNCTNKNCRYLHSNKVQVCRFGVNCFNYGCQYDHNPTLPSKEQLKWTKSQIL